MRESQYSPGDCTLGASWAPPFSAELSKFIMSVGLGVLEYCKPLKFRVPTRQRQTGGSTVRQVTLTQVKVTVTRARHLHSEHASQTNIILKLVESAYPSFPALNSRMRGGLEHDVSQT